jgi:hypothetical protein
VCNTGILSVPGAHFIKTYFKQHILLKIMILKLFSDWILDAAMCVTYVKVLIKCVSLCINIYLFCRVMCNVIVMEALEFLTNESTILSCAMNWWLEVRLKL